ncbi:XRE family transcriptional regulator [Rhodococcus sp. KBS0724]|uniref:XRE family transcriptional regulator n=1 Tax=Rhodococcus sp. KBS0724 TaxID=1179674 RepID=UPI00110D3C40|nr:XRE family transcriptional regulator [Rhodococcus sp. KBS0724]TSD40431.1 XRE family transcriptional regulator [Rhodococcus sp. KBS0724]
MYPSEVRQWTSMVRAPSSPEVLRRVAMLFDVPIQEVLIASGYMTEEESLPVDAAAMSLRQLSTDQILDELRRRASLDSGGSPVPVRVDGVVDQH